VSGYHVHSSSLGEYVSDSGQEWPCHIEVLKMYR